MRNWLWKIVRLVGRLLVRWLELLGENPPLSRHAWPGSRVADELAEQARRRAALRAAKAGEGRPAARERDGSAPSSGGGPDIMTRRLSRRPASRRSPRRTVLLGC